MPAEYEPRGVPSPNPLQRVVGATYALSMYFMFYLFHLFLLMPGLLLIFPFSLRLYRKFLDLLSWRCYYFINRWLEAGMGTKYECWIADSQQKGEGDPHSSRELLAQFSERDTSGLIISNHRTRLDWLMTYPFLERWGCVEQLRIVLKAELALIPGAGWAAQGFGFLFLKRSWDTDKVHMVSHLDHLIKTSPYPVQLLMYPEGTDLSEDNRKRSHAYSEKVGLPKYNYVMHPRQLGFAVTQHHMRKGTKGICVLTMAYQNHIPQNEGLILSGVAPAYVHFYFQYYRWAEVPADKEGSGKWVADRFAEMETRLEKFYQSGSFEGASKVPQPAIPWHGQPLVGIGTVQALLLFFFYAIWNYNWAWYWFWIANLLNIIATHGFGGLDKLEIKYWHRPDADLHND